MSTQRVTRAAEVTAWLVEHLPSVVGLDPEQVVDGPPTEANLRSTCIILGDVVFDGDWKGLGARNRDETATIKTVIYVLGPGQTQVEVNDTAYRLLGLIDLDLRNTIGDLATDVPGVQWISTQPTAIHKAVGDNARVAYLAVDLSYFARI
jgi:hypothetical protein